MIGRMVYLRSDKRARYRAPNADLGLEAAPRLVLEHVDIHVVEVSGAKRAKTDAIR